MAWRSDDETAFDDAEGGLLTEIEVAPGEDGRMRCSWCLGAPEYVEYHDRVWGRPMHGERELFEILTWDVDAVAGYGEADVERLLADASIVRNRAKIEATVANARAVAALHGRGSTLDEVLWSFAPAPEAPRPRSGDDLAATTPESKAMAKELKRLGFRFVGPTTAYSLMQAAGVNDHLEGCEFR
jgi:DNA-3-methyladenine glycosylase I